MVSKIYKEKRPFGIAPVFSSVINLRRGTRGFPQRSLDRRLKGYDRGTKGSGRLQCFPVFLLMSCVLLAHLSGCRTVEPKPSAYLPSERNIGTILDCAFDGFVFKREFSAILASLITTSWDPSGDWKGDIQGDATAFAPMLLYALARDTGEGEFLLMADRTVAYEAGLVKRFYLRPVPNASLVMGFPALAQPSIQNNDPTYRTLFLRGVRFGYALTSLSPGIFTPFVRERACVYGLMGYMCLVGAEVSVEPGQKDEFIRKGVKMIEKADALCWDESEALYAHSRLLDWPQETMMMALVKAYRLTGNRAYLDRARVVLDSMNRLCKDGDKGGYYGHPDLETKGLSGNNNMVWVLLDLYEATGDEGCLGEAHAALEWILSEDLYDSSKGLIRHHCTKGGAGARYYCTGCNFHTLVCIYRYNVLLREHAPARDRRAFLNTRGFPLDRRSGRRAEQSIQCKRLSKKEYSTTSAGPGKPYPSILWAIGDYRFQECFGCFSECGIRLLQTG